MYHSVYTDAADEWLVPQLSTNLRVNLFSHLATVMLAIIYIQYSEYIWNQGFNSLSMRSKMKTITTVNMLQIV